MDWNPLMCRVCLATSSERIDLKSAGYNGDVDWLEMFNLCTCLKAHPGDTLPKNLCQHCSIDLIASFEFYQKAQLADRLLKNQSQRKLHDRLIIEPAVKFSTTQQKTIDKYFIERLEENCSEKYDPTDLEPLIDNINSTIIDKITINTTITANKHGAKVDTTKDDYDLELNGNPYADLKVENSLEIDCESSKEEDFNEDYLEYNNVKEETEQMKTIEVNNSFQDDPDLERIFKEIMNSKCQKRCDLSNTSMDKSQISCSVCHEVFDQESELQQHISKKHKRGDSKSDVDGMTTCDLCGKTLRMCSLQCHKIRAHNKDKPFLCSECPKRFVSTCDLRIHSRSHDRTRKREFICNLCSKAFFDKQARDVHEKRHTGIKPFQCTNCGKSFFSRRALEVHCIVHNRESGKFKCNFCNKNFASNKDLIVHTRFHTGTFPFKCDLCYKSFAVKSHYTYHMAQHEGVVYKCSKCDKQFKNRGSLTNHRYLHEGTKIRICPICNKKLSTPFILKKHLNRHSIDVEKSNTP